MEAAYIDHMGSDLSVVNAARVSFGKRSHWVTEGYPTDPRKVLSKADTSLIQFLARGCSSGDWEELVDRIFATGHDSYYDDFSLNPVTDDETDANLLELRDLLQHVRNMPQHWTPFGHTAITLHIKAPIFVARQLGKHQVGFVWNEISRRYVSDIPEFYRPPVWRKAAANVKQGSSNEGVETCCIYDDSGELIHPDSAADDVVTLAVSMYNQMIHNGVCAEQARMVLPQSMYTEWYWTGNLYGFANVFKQRTDSHAQKEVQEIAHQIGNLIEPLFPVSWAALTE